MIGYCNASGIGLIPWAPIAAGKLARPLSTQTERSEATKRRGILWHEGDAEDEIVRRVEQIARKKEWPMVQVAIAWSMSKVTSPIIGINSVSAHPVLYLTLLMRTLQVERLEEAILGDKTLSEEDSAYLEEPCVSLYHICFAVS